MIEFNCALVASAGRRADGTGRGDCSPGLRSSVRDDRAAAVGFSPRFQFAPFRIDLSSALSCRLAAGSAHPAPLGGRFRRRTVFALCRARRAAVAGIVSSRLPRCEPGALRTRPADFRWPPAGLCKHPLFKGCGRARHDSQGGWRRAADLQEADPGRRWSPPDRDAVPALSRAIEGPDRARARLVRGCGAARLPLDALERCRCQWARYCARRPIWRKRGAPCR